MKKKSPKDTASKFEASLGQLERLIEELESGDISLEDSLKAFEEGVKLTRTAQKALEDAEQKVQLLIDENGRLTQQEFDEEDDE